MGKVVKAHLITYLQTGGTKPFMSIGKILQSGLIFPFVIRSKGLGFVSLL